MNCRHAIGGKINEIGETLCFCEITDNLENVTLGDCLGNCESQEGDKKETMEQTKNYTWESEKDAELWTNSTFETMKE